MSYLPEGGAYKEGVNRVYVTVRRMICERNPIFHWRGT